MWLTLIELVKLVAPDVKLDDYCIEPEWLLHQTPAPDTNPEPRL
jgi:hypothetical protein